MTGFIESSPWSLVRLGYFAKIGNGSTPSRDRAEFWGGSYPWLNSSKINERDIFGAEQCVTALALKACHLPRVPAESVLVAITGEGQTRGRAALLHTESTISQHLAYVVPKGSLSSQYVRYFFDAAYHWLRSESSGVGSTRAALTCEFLRGCSIPMPSLPKQEAVVRFLDRKTAAIDALIAKKERLIALLQEKRQALITQAVTKGLDPKVPMKDSGIPTVGQVPRHWKVQRAKTLFAERNERSTTGDEELLTVSHLTGVTPRSEKEVYMFQAETHVGYKVCHPGDLAVNTMWAWMGALGAVPKLGIISYSYHCYRQTCHKLLPAYFDKLFRTPAYVCEITRHSKGVWTSRLRLYPEAMLGLLVLVPPMEEQEAILSFIDSSLEQDNRLENLCRESVSKLREYRQVLISAAVTGQFSMDGGGYT